MATKVNATTSIGKARTERWASLFSDLVRSETRLYNGLNDVLRREHGIATSQFEALRYLRLHPNSRVAELAAHFAIGVGATSKTVDRLQAAGWVKRSSNPADRRSSFVELTTAGVRLVDAAEKTFQAQLKSLVIDVVGAEDAATLVRIMAALRGSLEAGGVGVPTG